MARDVHGFFCSSRGYKCSFGGISHSHVNIRILYAQTHTHTHTRKRALNSQTLQMSLQKRNLKRAFSEKKYYRKKKKNTGLYSFRLRILVYNRLCFFFIIYFYKTYFTISYNEEDKRKEYNYANLFINRRNVK